MDELHIQPLGQQGVGYTSNGPHAYAWWTGVAELDDFTRELVLEAVQKAEGVATCQWHVDPRVGACLVVQRESPYWAGGTGQAICEAISGVIQQPLSPVIGGADGPPAS